MKKGVEISRRRFLRVSGNAILLLAGAMWYGLTKRHIRSETFENKAIRINTLQNGVNFFGSFFILKEGNSYRAFSNRCTHLGCTIMKSHNGNIVCPCHGSEFNMADGSVIKGPATDALKELEYSTGPGEIIVKIN